MIKKQQVKAELMSKMPNELGKNKDKKYQDNGFDYRSKIVSFIT